MKKLIMVMMVIMPMIAHGAIMCSKNDTITIALDPSINGNTYGYNQAYSTWWTGFSYGTIRGLSACLSSDYGKGMGGTVSDLHDNNELVVGGETNGQYCWCKMTHPALSRWAFHYDLGSAPYCASICAGFCGNRVQNYPALRAGLFGSVAQN